MFPFFLCMVPNLSFQCCNMIARLVGDFYSQYALQSNPTNHINLVGTSVQCNCEFITSLADWSSLHHYIPILLLNAKRYCSRHLIIVLHNCTCHRGYLLQGAILNADNVEGDIYHM